MVGSSMTRVLSRLYITLISVLVIAILYLAKVLFLPLAFAILFAFLLAPAVSLFERMRLPRILAVLIVILGFGSVLGIIGWTVLNQLVDVADDLPVYGTDIAEKMAAIHGPTNSPFGRARREVEHLNQQLGLANSTPATAAMLQHPSDQKAPGTSAEKPLQVQEVERPSGRLVQLGGIVEPLLTGFLSVVFTFFVLLEREDLRNRVIRLTGHDHLNLMTQAMNDASRRISRYFLLQAMVNTVYGALVFIALYLVGLPHALLFGALSAMLRFIPYVGAPFAALLPTILSLGVFHEWTNSLYIMSIFLFLEVVTANYAEPRLYGKHTGLSSLAILIAAAFWTLLWGPVGLILSVPLTVCLVVVGRHVPYLEFLTVMLGDQPAIAPSAGFYQRLLARDEREAEEILENCLKEKSLEELYDTVILPALVMSEQDRHQKDLEESTVRFILKTTRDLIEELGTKEAAEPTKENTSGILSAEVTPTIIPKVLSIAVHDDADELGAIMLAQLLECRGMRSIAVPVGRLEQVLSIASTENPDVAFLCGLPPFGMARSRRLYRSLRVQHPQLKIMIGIWKYPDDGAKAAQEISRGEEGRITTTLAEAVAQVRSFLGVSDATAPVNEENAALVSVGGPSVT